MPRTARAIVSNYCYHVLNRGNNQMRLFHDRADYVAFLWLLAESFDAFDVPVQTASELGLEQTLKPRGRPRKAIVTTK